VDLLVSKIRWGAWGRRRKWPRWWRGWPRTSALQHRRGLRSLGRPGDILDGGGHADDRGLAGGRVPRCGGPGGAQDAGRGAMITEIKPGRGRIEVSGPGPRTGGRGAAAGAQGRRQPARDRRRGRGVVLGGPAGSVQVDATRSPFVVTAPPADSRMQKAFLLLESGWASSAATRARRAAGAVHESVSRPPVILSPRMGPVMPTRSRSSGKGYQSGATRCGCSADPVS